MTVLCIAELNIVCPADFRVEESESLSRTISISRSLPVRITASPPIGGSKSAGDIPLDNVTWLLNGSDPGLRLAHDIAVTWNMSYVSTGCSSVASNPAVYAACAAINTSITCITNVLKVSKYILTLWD